MYTFEQTTILCIDFYLENQENREIQSLLAYIAKLKKPKQISVSELQQRLIIQENPSLILS